MHHQQYIYKQNIGYDGEAIMAKYYLNQYLYYLGLLETYDIYFNTHYVKNSIGRRVI